ncbi:MAG: ABC transporter permease [Acidobacteriota bacterium]
MKTGDWKLAVRNVRRAPGAALAVILTVGIGVAATATIFAVVDALYLRPLPGVERPSELVNVHATSPDGSTFHSVSYPAWKALTTPDGPFSGLAAFSSRLVSVGAGGDPRLAIAQIVTGNYFQVLGSSPTLGRLLNPSDDSPSAQPAAVVSEAAWRDRFGADPSAVGRTVLVNGRAFTVVGVAAPGFTGTFLGQPFDVWLTIGGAGAIAGANVDSPDHAWLELVGRRKPGVSIAMASRALSVMAPRLERQWPVAHRGVRFDVRQTTGFEDSLKGPAAAFFTVLAALALLVLGIACANVTGILLARALGREREMGIRAALGAGRATLVRLLLVENLFQFLAGGVVGVAISFWTAPLLERFDLPTPVPFSFHFAPGGRVILFGMAAAALAGLLFGVIPAILATRPDRAAFLREGMPTERRGTSRIRSVFVAGQVAISVLLLVAAALFAQTVRNAAAANPGFSPDGLSVASVDLSLLGYDADRARAAFDRLTEGVRGIPGVTSATTATPLPLGLSHRTARVGLPGSPAEGRPSVEIGDVGDEFFETLRIPVVRGRSFNAGDRSGSAPVAVINETLARTLWPGGDPLGRTISAADGSVTVIGVARDGKYRQLWEAPRGFLFFSARQSVRTKRELVVRGGGSPAALAAALRNEWKRLDPALPPAVILPMRKYIGFSTLPQRVAGAVSGALGAVGLLLTAIGLAGLVAYSVSRRTREIGLRMAVGAAPRDVLLLEMRRIVVVAAAGLAAGCVLAALSTRALAGLLFGVAATDPLTFAAVATVLAFTTVLASWLPARRAARLDPLAALKSE